VNRPMRRADGLALVAESFEHDAEWYRCDEEGSFFMTEIKKSIRALA